MTDIQYLAPRTLDEAISAYAAADGAGRILAGGTDLLVQMQAGMVEQQKLIVVHDAPKGFYIGRSTLRISNQFARQRMAIYQIIIFA